jgi:hypothetical protein
MAPKTMVYCRFVNCHVYKDRLPERCHPNFDHATTCYTCPLSTDSEKIPLSDLIAKIPK